MKYCENKSIAGRKNRKPCYFRLESTRRDDSDSRNSPCTGVEEIAKEGLVRKIKCKKIKFEYDKIGHFDLDVLRPPSSAHSLSR